MSLCSLCFVVTHLCGRSWSSKVPGDRGQKAQRAAAVGVRGDSVCWRGQGGIRRWA